MSEHADLLQNAIRNSKLLAISHPYSKEDLH
jgi:hypothetical protein